MATKRSSLEVHCQNIPIIIATSDGGRPQMDLALADGAGQILHDAGDTVGGLLPTLDVVEVDQAQLRIQTLERTYGHHHPDRQRRAAEV